jgi:predicted XRE-type DNA-binding protein
MQTRKKIGALIYTFVAENALEQDKVSTMIANYKQ